MAYFVVISVLRCHGGVGIDTFSLFSENCGDGLSSHRH